MSKFKFVCCVLFSCLCATCSFKCTLKEIKNKFPGEIKENKYPKDVFFADDSKGHLRQIKMKGDANSTRNLQIFLQKEEELSKKCKDGLTLKPTFLAKLVTAEQQNGSNKFNFYRKDVDFTLYNKMHPKGINLRTFDFSKYDYKQSTKVVTHGFLSSGEAEACVAIKNNYLKTSQHNIIILDWSYLASNPLYPAIVFLLGPLADYCAEFLTFLFDVVGVKSADTHLIGHSLGAQLFGFVARRTKLYGKPIGIVTGLDPAGPLFDSCHLNASDSDFVQVIHTDAGFLGIDKSIGHVDFWPNGGEAPQPGCKSGILAILLIDSCSHGRSHQLYAKSIENKKLYVANCTGNIKVPMGSATPSSSRGDCHLETV